MDLSFSESPGIWAKLLALLLLPGSWLLKLAVDLCDSDWAAPPSTSALDKHGWSDLDDEMARTAAWELLWLRAPPSCLLLLLLLVLAWELSLP